MECLRFSLLPVSTAASWELKPRRAGVIQGSFKMKAHSFFVPVGTSSRETKGTGLDSVLFACTLR